MTVGKNEQVNVLHGSINNHDDHDALQQETRQILIFYFCSSIR